MDSKVRKQLDLLPERKPEEPHVEPVTPELIQSIRRRRTFLEAWNYAQTFACLEDKEVYDPLQMDASHWGKIRKGTASPPGDDRFTRYFDVVKNEFPLVWLCEARGYDFLTLRKHRTSEQRRIAELETENADLRRLVRLQTDLRSGK